MFRFTLERALVFRLAAGTCWGTRRFVAPSLQNRLWRLDPKGFDTPLVEETTVDPHDRRVRLLHGYAKSGRLTPIEIRTLEALLLDRLTIREIADREASAARP